MQFLPHVYFPKVSSSCAKNEVRHKEVTKQYSVKRSFSIKNIQNPLWRDYHRGQTVLLFEENVLEDRWNQKEFFHENYQNYYKRQ